MEECCCYLFGHKSGVRFSLTLKELNIFQKYTCSKLLKLWRWPLGLKHVLFFFIPTVPSPVKNIQVIVKTDSIHASWSPGSGHVDLYKLVLFDNHGTVHESHQENPLTSYTFSGLTAGHLYNLSVITQAAELESTAFRIVRTGMISEFFTTEQEANNLAILEHT